ncbi:MarR family winged helix-turn-helix transcriptional regulator [Breznakia pachnodae]|uniref:HTH-type transcriptional regulator MgrA n=1 Tax=Breznakia pachnodae TaxID=265178 RepID=A0ABU0DZT8_9FIRM|nr:transcriptional regulator [Breznakia pachnodae]MDQ0360148.1 DNA-binding MarR family transcriptional regulator [Breznakia pachnodae]
MNWDLIKKSEKLKTDMEAVGLIIMQPFYEEYGMNFLKLSILTEASTVENLTLNALSQSVGKATANMSVVVTTLVNDGYLKKVASAYDRRVTYIHITKKGKQIVEKSHKFLMDRYAQVMDDDDSEILELIKAQEKYLAKLRQIK